MPRRRACRSRRRGDVDPPALAPSRPVRLPPQEPAHGHHLELEPLASGLLRPSADVDLCARTRGEIDPRDGPRPRWAPLAALRAPGELRPLVGHAERRLDSIQEQPEYDESARRVAAPLVVAFDITDEQVPLRAGHDAGGDVDGAPARAPARHDHPVRVPDADEVPRALELVRAERHGAVPPRRKRARADDALALDVGDLEEDRTCAEELRRLAGEGVQVGLGEHARHGGAQLVDAKARHRARERPDVDHGGLRDHMLDAPLCCGRERGALPHRSWGRQTSSV